MMQPPLLIKAYFLAGKLLHLLNFDFMIEVSSRAGDFINSQESCCQSASWK